MKRIPFSLMWVMMASAVAWAAPPKNGPPAAPLLFVKLLGPAGMKVTFHPGTELSQSLAAPAVVGLRPGYTYRVELSDLPDFPGLKLYPTLEVRGALHLPLDKVQRHPVPIVFYNEEILRIVEKAALVTKVHYLEDPANAAPIPTTADEPLVTDLTTEYDPMAEARIRGRIMIVLRMGERTPVAAELAASVVPNTILFHGMNRLASPPVAPPIPWAYWPVYDPLVGNKPATEECLPDGGDTGPRAGIAPDGKLGGLNPSDTVIEYTSNLGRRHVACSNRVNICVPRFSVLRLTHIPFDFAIANSASVARSTKSGEEAKNRLGTGRADNVTSLSGTLGAKRPSALRNRFALTGFESGKSAQAFGSVSGTQFVATSTEIDQMTAFPFNEPISLFKSFEPKESQIGDVITFYLRYHNHTKQPVDNLVITDSLTARLEYVPGSARSDRESAVTIQANEAGSVILRFEMAGKLLPAQGGVVSFQARIR